MANPSWGWTAGAAISTLHDLKIWARALATGTLLRAATQKERLSWIPIGASPAAAKYGLAITNIHGFLGHNGQLPGFQSFMGYLPQKGATIVVLTNLYAAPDGSGPADQLAAIIMKELFA
jgi:D-alanyl-D-alanine carboxypeptidase